MCVCVEGVGAGGRHEVSSLQCQVCVLYPTWGLALKHSSSEKPLDRPSAPCAHAHFLGVRTEQQLCGAEIPVSQGVRVPITMLH